jgi:hypothetical protein
MESARRNFTGSSPERSQPDVKQRQDFDDRLRRLQIEFRRDSFSYDYVFSFSRPARDLIWREGFGIEVAATTGSGDGGGTRVVARARFWGGIGMGMHWGGAPKLI